MGKELAPGAARGALWVWAVGGPGEERPGVQAHVLGEAGSAVVEAKGVCVAWEDSQGGPAGQPCVSLGGSRASCCGRDVT